LTEWALSLCTIELQCIVLHSSFVILFHFEIFCSSVELYVFLTGTQGQNHWMHYKDQWIEQTRERMHNYHVCWQIWTGTIAYEVVVNQSSHNSKWYQEATILDINVDTLWMLLHFWVCLWQYIALAIFICSPLSNAMLCSLRVILSHQQQHWYRMGEGKILM